MLKSSIGNGQQTTRGVFQWKASLCMLCITKLIFLAEVNVLLPCSVEHNYFRRLGVDLTRIPSASDRIDI